MDIEISANTDLAGGGTVYRCVRMTVLALCSLLNGCVDASSKTVPHSQAKHVVTYAAYLLIGQVWRFAWL
jgi:hypothetical protein